MDARAYADFAYFLSLRLSRGLCSRGYCNIHAGRLPRDNQRRTEERACTNFLSGPPYYVKIAGKKSNLERIMEIVVANNVRKNFGSLEVLNGVSISANKGEVISLIGRSGSGKSTFLRCLNGLEMIDSGTISVAGHDLQSSPSALRSLRQDVGMVFQSYNLFPHLTVLENLVLAPMRVKRLNRKIAIEIAEETLRLVGLTSKASNFAHELSGGQQQRVAIARAVAMSPKVMLFDEVTSALDPELTAEVLAVMERLAAGGMTMLLVTHEMAFARRISDRVVFMHGGKIFEEGPPNVLFSAPSTPELRAFISSEHTSDLAAVGSTRM